MRRGLVGLVLLGVACGDDDHVIVVDGGVLEAGAPATVRVHTTAPSTSLSLPGPNNATYAMAQNADGSWSRLEPSELGLYAVPLRGDRWTATFVCADQDNAYVSIYDRAASVTDLTIELPPPCALGPGDVGDITGTFAHAPPATSWFDFGYAADERGSSLPLTGDSASYEVVNVVTGTWDLVFGFRDDGAGPLTKLFIARDAPVTTSTTLDGDLGAAGIAPGSKALTIAGLATDEQIHAPVIYALAGGPHGIDMGPPITVGPNLTYATVPAEQQRPTDRYRLAFSAATPDGVGTRGANATFHDAIDVALELPPALAVPSYTTVATAPYLRLGMKMTGRASVATHELTALTATTERTGRRWTYSTDAAFADGAEVAFELPDFSAVSGWNGAWTVQTDRTSVIATVREKSSPLSDGTLERFATQKIPFVP